MARQWDLRATPPALARRYLADGTWADHTLGSLLASRVQRDLEVHVWSRTRPHHASAAELFTAAAHVAGSLRQRGIGPGEVVVLQLPNCPEAAVVFWGVALAGAVAVPVVHFYGPREVSFIVEQSQPALTVLTDPGNLGGTDGGDVHVVDLSDAPLALGSLLDAAPLEAPVGASPDTPALIAYTSGTTADPKGVIHTHRSIVAEIDQLSSIQVPGDRPLLTGAPVGHAIGMLSGLLLPIHRRTPAHLVDVWDAEFVLDVMVRADVNAGSGATFFLQSLLDAPGCRPEHLERMRHVGLGGATVPEALADRAIAAGISVARSYGSTEHPSVTGASHDLPQAKRKATDGLPMRGVEVRVVTPDGGDAPRGVPGEVWTRGPELCAGYTDPALTAAAFDTEGWYHSGDVGVLDADGWLTITDRLADVIIRGGENVSAVEVEGLLLGLPGVAEAAVVAAPDARLGEHAAAFLRLHPGVAAPSLDDVRRYLAAAGLAKQKWPEAVHAVADLPRTPSGKVKKHELRARLRSQEAR